MRPWQFTLSAILLTLAIVAGMSLLIHGRVTWDYLLTGFVAALVVAFIITNLIFTAFALAAESRALYQRAMEASSVGILIADAQAPDLPLIYVNPAFERITGHAAAEALGRNCRFLQGTDREQPALEAIRSALRTGSDGHGLLRNVRKDGTLFWNELVITPVRDGIGRLTHFIGVMKDITEHVRAEQALQASEFRLRTVLDSMVDGVIVIDERGGIESFNPAAERLFGYHADEVAGQNVSLLMPEPYAAAHDGYLRRYLETGEARIIGVGREVTGRRKDGATFPMDLSVNPMVSDGRRCFVGVVRDISARKAVELQLVQALQTAQVASRAKSEFLSSMSHELRTPMNAILGFAQLLNMDRGLGEEQTDNVAEILKAGHHLLALIGEVLDLSRIESGRLSLSMEPVALTELIEECAALVESGAVRQGLVMERNLVACEHRWVRADRLRLKQVLINLLSNAVKYNRQGGMVGIECGFATPGRIRLSVRDTGLGIAADKQAELFTAFHRLGRENSNIEGTGIGLVISKKLVELMGGDIGLESQPEQGSTFWVELAESAPLPQSDPREEGAAPLADRTAADPGKHQHTVLYVEDNPANLRLVQQALARRPDIRLLTSGDPLEGLDLARGQRPDLILLDINLPVMDGYELLGRLRDDPDTRTIPAIAISANAMPGDIQRGLEAGFRVYLTKPLDLNRLLEEIDLTQRQTARGTEKDAGHD